jgi:hypothetical protein
MYMYTWQVSCVDKLLIIGLAGFMDGLASSTGTLWREGNHR